MYIYIINYIYGYGESFCIYIYISIMYHKLLGNFSCPDSFGMILTSNSRHGDEFIFGFTALHMMSK